MAGETLEHGHHIALIGLSGTGKTSVGKYLAALLGRPFLDTDSLIEEATGRTIAELFGSHGELAFRDLEAAALKQAIAGEPAVLATGGGIVLREENRQLLRSACWNVWLVGEPERLVQRLEQDSVERPLLRGGASERLRTLMEERRPLYAELADWTVQSDELTIEQVAQQVLQGWQRGVPEALWVTTSTGRYQLVIAPGLVDRLPTYLDSLKLYGRCWLITDSHVGPLYAARVEATLARAGRTVASYTVPAAEQSKSLGLVEALYDWLLAGGVERGDIVLALGGGVVGDLAGFVASTILRGVMLIHLPTTVLAMVDSSIGGKTGINHPRGKNLIGTFYPPRLILSDTQTLKTLQRREYIAGLAEAIKHGVIADAQLFTDLEHSTEALLRIEEPLTGELLRRAAAVKVTIVSADEREAGQRMLLNYGHTLGHAIEQAAGYGVLLHGEAVAIGMELAAKIAVRLGRFSSAEAERQRALLEQVGLPVAPPAGLSVDALLAPVGLDKKRQAGAVRWVLPDRIGAAVVVDDVPMALVRDVVTEALSHKSSKNV